MKKIVLSSVVALMMSTSLSADFLGAEAGVAFWNTKVDGNIKKGTDSIDLQKDLGYGNSQTNNFFYASFDHPIPLLPNIKVQQTNFSDDASGNITRNLTFAGQSFGASLPTTSSLTLKQTDIIPYWRILDNWVNFDIGLNIRNIAGNIKIDSALQHVDEDFNVIIPMAYAKARFDLPFSGLSVEADGSYIGFDGSSVTDIKGGVVYETPFGLGATLGYRKQNITLDDIDSTYGDINVKGIYGGVFLHF
ncbi:MAG: TIGR04219 family outer membrane beta-barrel protein [Arcobacteraceae bacterium]|jgi:outer membrane protein|nr:TIGR04219 family outer membrane beta-barrel protein [Arcobacteraceae bacterium]